MLEPAYVAGFSEMVGFHRRDEPGLSVAIAFPQRDLTAEDLIPIVIENYFFPIIAGSLVVEIDGELVSAATFDRLARSHRSGALSDGHLIGFIREIEAARRQPPVLELPDDWAKAGLGESLTEEALAAMRDAYDRHQLISVRAPMNLRSKTHSETVPGYFDLFLRKATDEVPASALKPLFIRGSITVPNEELNFRNRRAFAALVATEPNVSRFLRDAENPAHTSWNGNAGKLNDRWRAAGQRLREIRHALAQLHQLLDQAVSRRDNEALKTLLYLPDQTAPRPTPGPGTSVRDRFPPIAPAPKLFDVSRRRGGFTLRGGDALATATLPMLIAVQAAYDLPVGNPFKKHSPHDFNFRIGQDISIKTNGASWQAPTANRLLLNVKNADFSVEVLGFDENRDLVIAASRVEDEAPL